MEGSDGRWRVISDGGERSQWPGLTAGAAARLHSPLPGRGLASHRLRGANAFSRHHWPWCNHDFIGSF